MHVTGARIRNDGDLKAADEDCAEYWPKQVAAHP